MSDPFPSVSVQESVIGASLNASMLQNVLIGIYTMIYSATMFLYILRNKPNQRIVVSTITILYLLCMTTFIIGWYWLDQWMVHNGSTRQDIFISNLQGPPPFFFVFNDFIFYLGFVVSDGLLIWRCYHVWGMSRRVIIIPSMLFLAESGLLVTSTVLSALLQGPISSNARVGHQFNNIISALVFISLITTLTTTFLIGYRIHTVASMNASLSSESGAPATGTQRKRQLTHVLTMIVESAAMYAVMLVVLAVSNLVPSFEDIYSPAGISTYYIESVAGIVAGIAPTLLMARIALKDVVTEHTDDVEPKSPHISELRFGSTPVEVAGVRRTCSETHSDPSVMSICVAGGQSDMDGLEKGNGKVGDVGEGTEKVE